MAQPVVLDNTALTNFAKVDRAGLVRKLWAERASTTPMAMDEYLAAVEKGSLPADAWSDLSLAELSEEEQNTHTSLPSRLGNGERSCIAVAHHRQGILVTDDMDARKAASRLGVRSTGTLGVLVLCIKQELLTLEEGNRLLESMIAHNYRSPFDKLDDLL